MTTRFLEVPLSIKSIQDEDGIFEGYGSVFGNVDADGDVLELGAFGKSLQLHQQQKTQPALLWMHDPQHPVGRYLEIREDAQGLYVKGQLILDSTQGRDAYALLKGGAINGLSIGYVPKEWELDKSQKTRRLKAVDLWEISLVTFPANTLARVMTVKSKIATGDIPTLEELEQFLVREGAMNQDAVQVFLKSGYDAYVAYAQDSTGDDAFSLQEFETLTALIKTIQ